MDDIDREPNGIHFHGEINEKYESEMFESEEWLDEGHFLRQTFLKDAEGVDVQIPTLRPLRVHTFLRDIRDEAISHPSHPFLAFVYLLKNSQEKSEVVISAPYLTDAHVIDQLAYYAKPVAEGGRKLVIKVILGPEPCNVDVIEKFIGDDDQKFWSVRRLQFRIFGNVQTEHTKGKMVHSKSMVTSTGAMVGSYNYSYASRFRNREEGFLFSPDSRYCSEIRDDLLAVWDISEEYKMKSPREKRDAKAVEEAKRARSFPPGYCPPGAT